MGRPLKKDFLHVLYIYPYNNEGHALIAAQKGSRRYTAQGFGADVFKLVATETLAPHQAYMIAYDSDGNTYFVTKLTRHYAVVHRNYNNEAAWQFADPSVYPNGQRVKWVANESNGTVNIVGAVTGQTVRPEWND